MMKFLHALADLFRETYEGWSHSEPDLHATAVAFSALFSLAPLLVLTIVIVGQAFEERVLRSIVGGIADAIGPDAARWVNDLITNRRNESSSLIAAVVSLVVLISGASGLVLRLQASLNAMWHLSAKPQSNLRANLMMVLRQRAVSGVMAVGIGLLLWVVLLFNTVLTIVYEQTAQPWLTSFGVSAPHDPGWTAPLVYFVAFAVMYRVLPEATIRWRDVLPGAALTALLFWLASFLIRLYLLVGFTASVYGAAGAVIVLLLWINYSAMIILFGAKFTELYANKYGEPIVPRPHMMFKQRQ